MLIVTVVSVTLTKDATDFTVSFPGAVDVSVAPNGYTT